LIVFLTGATGYIGGVIAEKLMEAGHDVRSLARSPLAASDLKYRGIEAITGDLFDIDAVVAGVAGCNAVIHTAFTKDARAEEADRNAVQAMLGALDSKDTAFIYTSSNLVLGSTGRDVVSESSLPDPTPSVLWRPKVESMVSNAVQHGIRSVVIRPGWVYGRGRGLLGMMVASAENDGYLEFIGDGENHMTFVHVDDLADLYMLALGRADAGSLYSATVLPAIKYRAVAAAASVAGGASGRCHTWDLEDAVSVMGVAAYNFVVDQKLSGEKATIELGWDPSRPSVMEELSSGSYATLNNMN